MDGDPVLLIDCAIDIWAVFVKSSVDNIGHGVILPEILGWDEIIGIACVAPHNLMGDYSVRWSIGRSIDAKSVSMEIFNHSSDLTVLLIPGFQHLLDAWRREEHLSRFGGSSIGQHNGIVSQMRDWCSQTSLRSIDDSIASDFITS